MHQRRAEFAALDEAKPVDGGLDSCPPVAIVLLLGMQPSWTEASFDPTGIALMIGEAVTPGFGILGIGGVIAFIAGAAFLFEGGDADISFAISLPLIIGVAVVTAALIFGVIAAALEARKRPTATGAEQLIGSIAQVVDWSGPHGSVRVHGEIWSARSDRAMNPGDSVRVVGRDRLTLIVEP
jgi:membrane-bound serine protease (ClpP class)